jgi:methionyl-tRNA synthetase
MPTPYFVTTPIYYVNDRPHIGHCYTTLVADVAARAARLAGRDVFFLTGTDEHAEKVVAKAREAGVSTGAWADRNAAAFRDAFAFMNFSNDDFIRTTEDRHKTRASAYIERLVASGDIELGDYEGWFDASQEEYVTETAAKEHGYNSPVTGRPRESRTEQNYFFRLDRYEGWLRAAIEGGAIRVLPEARKNEVLGRLAQGLNKVPVSRRIREGDADWGVKMPGDPEHRVYVWIEALCNYLTVVDTPERRKYWPRPDGEGGDRPAPVTHFMAKDILWFHAVVWPAMLHALGERPPAVIYAHAYFIAEGRKMSKSLGNFIEIDLLRAYADRFSLDALRWFLATQGPLGANDADFSYARFVEVYNADLANGIGNATSRVANMIGKYFDGRVTHVCDGRYGFPGGTALQLATKALETAGRPVPEARTFDFAPMCRAAVERAGAHLDNFDLIAMLGEGISIVRQVDDFISYAAPFTLAKQVGTLGGADEALAAILYSCAEALRVASLLLSPAMPEKMAELWRRWDCAHLTDADDANSAFVAPLAELAKWAGPHGLRKGHAITVGEPLFMRADAKDPAPEA